MSDAVRDVLPEDRLLWEFWLNHGYDREALKRCLSGLPAEANGDYIAVNAHYGCFEDDVFRFVEAERAQCPASDLPRALRRIREGPAPRVTIESPEGRLLALLSLRPAAGSEEERVATQAMLLVTCWPAFVRAAARSNLVTAAASGMAIPGVGATSSPGFDEARSTLRRAAAGILSRNRRLFTVLDRILDAFAASGLAPVLLKETALQGDLYRGEGDRMAGDLDILFHDDQVEAAEKVLLGMGYASFEGIWSRAWYREHHHHIAPLVSPEDAIKIEPHMGIWIPTGPSGPIIPELIAASRQHPRFRARRPSAAHVLFHLLVDLHGNASIGKLGQAADAALLIRAEGRDVDAGVLSDLVRRTGAAPFIEDSLHLLTRVYGKGFLASACPALLGFRGEKRVSLERRLLRRAALTHFCGFEPAASPMSLAGVRLFHKALLRPGSRMSRLSFLFSGAFGAPQDEGGMGGIARKSRPPRSTQIIRAAGFPFRMASRLLRGRSRRS